MSEIALRAEQPAPVRSLRWLGVALVLLASAACLYAVWILYLLGQPLLAVLVLGLVVAFAAIFTQRRFYAGRFIFPGIAAILLFVVFPVVYTVYLGFTNYSFLNLLTFERAREVLLSRTVIDTESERPFALVNENGQYRVFLPEGEGGLLSEPFALDGTAVTVATSPVATAPEVLAMRDLLPLRANLAFVTLTLPEGPDLKLSGLRNFASVAQEYELQPDDSLVSTIDGTTLRPDQTVGFYRDEAGKTVPPGWAVNIGTANFNKVFNSQGIREPMGAIFVWTLSFALLSVGLTFALGLLLATILQWPHLRFKPLYRLLLILPYSVPAFISILIFKGLFNQNYGEINLILKYVFGIAPDWNTDPWLARAMIVIVNVWLGYPYMMLLSMGFLQSVPEDHKKAAALEGASPLRVFFTITLPQILPPFLPLLIASFAFNFNNLVLVLLLTRGLPDMIGTIVPAGSTDILASFTYRISFLDSGQQFGLSGAISLIIFVIVAVIAYGNFYAVKRAAARGQHMIVENPRDLRWKQLGAHIFLIAFIVLIMFPFLVVVSISLREGNFSTGSLLPDRPTLEHWYLALGQAFTRADGTVVQPPYPVMWWMFNSIKIALIASVGIVIISTISAYAFSRVRFRGRSALLDTLFIIQIFPTTLALIAVYSIFDGLGDVTPVLGIDSHWSVILVYMSWVTLHIWTIKGYFDSVDPALDKAANIDGATPWQTFRHVFLPLAVPIIAVVFVLSFIGIINDYPIASVLLRSQDTLTIAVGSRFYLNEKLYLWGDFAAAAILSGLPITIVFLIAQRYLVSGLSEGGVKG